MSSFTMLPADLVLNACDAYMDSREKRIKRERQELIDSHIGERPWFGFGKPATREEVEAEYADELSYIKITGGMWYNKVYELRSLARVAQKSNTLVHIDAEMASTLSAYF